jgi:glutamate formiminotransferase/formiminotetrahydrofolate cyclodeaminase
MVATLTLGRSRYASVAGEMEEIARQAHVLAHELEALAGRDAEAYAAVTDAQRLPAISVHDRERRDDALHEALRAATHIPLQVARLAADVAALTAALAERGNRNAITDAGVAALLADAACRAAAYNVRVNVRSLADLGDTEADAMTRTVGEYVERASSLADGVAARVNAAL